jgi:hypothetical protein
MMLNVKYRKKWIESDAMYFYLELDLKKKQMWFFKICLE